MITVHATYEISPATHLEIAQGDLTQAPVDAIVNAANEHLAHGAGIAAAIVKKGGPSIQQESNAWVREHGQVTHAEPAYTHGGKLPARYIIHAVGPVWGAGDEDAKLASAIRGSLKRAEELQCKTIAFPAISAGIFGFPKQRNARIFFETFKDYFAEKEDTGIRLVQVVLWDDNMLNIFLEESRRVIGNEG
jgi:O-acetyl-ADP-ribose deacetylase (regulator of RNase III)